MKKVKFAIIGGILGIPLSYYFQSEIVKAKAGGIGGYMSHIGEIAKDSNLCGNIILSIIIFAFVGGFIGYMVDENEAKKAK